MRWSTVLSAVIVVLLLCAVVPAAQAQQGGPSGLKVDGAIVRLEDATPGQKLVHKMRVSSSMALDCTVEASGFGQTLEGAYLAIKPAEDTSPYSARTFIQDIDKRSFKLEPNQPVEVSATIVVPQDISPNAHYAIIHIHSQPTGEGPVGFEVAAHVPVVVTPKGAKLNDVGRIAELKVAPVRSGQPIEIYTVFENTGNHHYRVLNAITVYDAQNKPVATAKVSGGNSSIIPGFRYQFKATPSLLNLNAPLPLGAYTVESIVQQEDGAALDTRKAEFQVDAPYEPLPGVDKASLVLVNYNDEVPGLLDARRQADVEIAFSDTGKVTGVVAVGKYNQPPQGAELPAKTAAGAKQTAVKYVAARVEGFSQGLAHITVYYRPEELGKLDENSLFLTYWNGERWQKLGSLSVQTGADAVRGDLGVGDLNKAPVIALASESKPSGIEALVASLTGKPTRLYLGGGAIIVIVLLVVAFGKRKSAKIKTSDREEGKA